MFLSYIFVPLLYIHSLALLLFSNFLLLFIFINIFKAVLIEHKNNETCTLALKSLGLEFFVRNYFFLNKKDVLT